MVAVREAVTQYISDNVGWRAEDRDLVWSHRYVTAKLSLLYGKTMPFSELVDQIRAALSETTAPQVQLLTPELIAEKICRSTGEFVPAPIVEVSPELMPGESPGT